MDGNDPKHVVITLPQVTPKVHKLALKVAAARFQFQNADGSGDYRIPEITADMLKAEARRIADIQDSQKRATEVFQCLTACLRLVEESQELADDVCVLADELRTTSQQFEEMQKMTEIRRIQRNSDTSEP